MSDHPVTLRAHSAIVVLPIEAPVVPPTPSSEPDQLYETLLRHDRPLAWWGLDTDTTTLDDSGNGYTLTAVSSPTGAATLIPHGDDGVNGSRDFDGTDDYYYTADTQYAAADGPPTFHASATATATATATAELLTPADIVTGDLMIAVLVHSGNLGPTISSAPAGWTQIGSTVTDTQSATAVYRKTAVAADEAQATLTWTWSIAGSLVSAILVYRGCDPAVANLVYDSSVTTFGSADQVKTTPSETFPDQSRFLVIWTTETFSTITPDPNFVINRLTLTNGQMKLQAVEYIEEEAGSRTRHANLSLADQCTATVITFGSPEQVVNESLHTIDSTLSIHAIIRPSSVTGARAIVFKDGSWAFYLENAGFPIFYYRDGAGVDRYIAFPDLINVDTTYHLVLVDDATGYVHLYVDGVKYTIERTGDAGYTSSGSGQVEIGRLFSGNFFNGKIDEVAVWDCAVTDDMVATLYEAYSAGTFGSDHLNQYSPRLKLEVAWASAPADACYAWHDVTEFCQGAATSRGRNFELDRMETGRCDFELDNRGGEFQPENAESPYYPYVIPTRPVRLRAQAETDGLVYALFFGYTEGHPVVRPSYGHDSRARFTAADTMKALSLDKVLEQAVRGPELAGARIEAVLAGIEGVLYELDAGQSLVVGDDIQGLNRLDHVQVVSATDGGIVFSDGAGVVQFQDRHYRTINEAVSRVDYSTDEDATYRALRLEPEIDEARLFTTAAITPASGNTKTAEDADAVRQHYRRAKEVQTLHVQDNDAQAMAEGYVERYSTARIFFPEFDVRPTTEAGWAAALSHELSHRITTFDWPLGVDSVGTWMTHQHFIERIEHTIAQNDWRVKVGVSPAELESNYWIMDVGELGDEIDRTATVLGW